MPVQPEPRLFCSPDDAACMAASGQVPQQRVQNFVVSALKALGQRPELVDGVWCCEVTGSLLSVLQVPKLRMVFDQSLAERVPDAVYVTVGSDVFERLVSIIANQFPVANLAYLDRAYWKTPTPWLPVVGVSSNMTQCRLFFQREVLFYFRVRLSADEVEESLVPVVIDPETEAADTVPPLENAVSLGKVSEHPPVVSTLSEPLDYESLEPHLAKMTSLTESYSLQKLYKAACISLESEIKPLVQDFQRRVGQRQEQEIRRLERYYEGRRIEALDPLRRLFRRMAGFRARLEMARTMQSEARYGRQVERLKSEMTRAEEQYQREIASLEEERKLRIAELRARYQLHVEADLVSAGYLWVPRWELSYQLTGTTEDQRLHSSTRERTVRDFVATYDLVRKRFVNFVCDHCGRSTDYLFLCAEGDLVCSHCYGSCGGCGTPICAECAIGFCHVCGELVCSDCGTCCALRITAGTFGENGFFENPGNVVLVCPKCQSQYCSMCRSLFG